MMSDELFRHIIMYFCIGGLLGILLGFISWWLR